MTLIAQANPFADNKVRRNGKGQYLVAPPGSNKERGYTRATTVVKALSQMDWGPRDCRFLAQGLAEHHAEFIPQIKAVDETWKLTRLVNQILDRTDCHAGRNHGTRMHDLIEQINHGQQPDRTAAEQRDIDAYYHALKTEGITVLPEYMERMVVVDEHGIGGMLDNIFAVPPRECGCTLRIGDLKTGSAIYTAELATQLHIYRSGVFYDQATGARTPLPDGLCTHWGLGVHLPRGEGRCVTHDIPLDLGAQGLALALSVRGFGARVKQQIRGEHTVPVRLDPPATAAVEEQSIEALIDATNDVRPAWVQTLGEQSTALLSTDRPTALKRRIDDLRAAGHLPLLKANWPADIAMGNPTPQHTTAQLDAIENALWAVEGAVRAPFPGADEPVPAKVLEEDVNYYAPVPYAARGAVVLERPKQPDEGGPLDAATVAELKTTAGTIRTATPKQWGWVERALRDMRQAGHPLDVSNNPTVRTGALLRALMAVSAIAMEADGDNGVRELLASVTGSEQACHPTVSIPEFFATLSIDEARTLTALLDTGCTVVKEAAA